MSATRRIRAAAGVASLLMLGLPVLDPTPVTASAEIEVTTTEDELNADGDCSLREAVVAANTNLPVDACPAGAAGLDAVTLQPVTYTLSIPGRDEDAAETGDLDITGDLTIRTDVADQWARIDANGIDRVFDVMSQATWHFHLLEITGGDAADGEGGGVRVRDGLCDADGRPTTTGSIHASTIRDNVAARGGGLHIGTCRHPWLRWLSIVENRAVAEGGGVSLTGESNFGLAVSTVSSNTAAIGGGLWIDNRWPPGTSHLSHVTIAANAAHEAAGIWTADWTTLADTVLGDNHGPNCGGPGHASWGLADDDTCGSFPPLDLGLLPLTQVGQHYVHPPGPNSIVVDFAGEPFPMWCDAESSGDQIGNRWPIDGNGDGLAACDAGAVEAPEGTAQPPAQPPPPAPPATEPSIPDTAQPSSGTNRSTWPGIIGALLVVAGLARVAPIRTVRWRPRHIRTARRIDPRSTQTHRPRSGVREPFR